MDLHKIWGGSHHNLSPPSFSSLLPSLRSTVSQSEDVVRDVVSSPLIEVLRSQSFIIHRLHEKCQKGSTQWTF